MSLYIGFLRAVNVGGRVVKMEALRGHLEAAGFTDVATYIQTGNVLLGSSARSTSKVESLVEKALEDALGFEVPTLVRTPKQLSAIVDDAPDSPLGEKARHYVDFLREKPTATAAKELNGWDVEGERLTLVGRDLHMWFTKPAHKAKATRARIEKITGMHGTNRSWTVVSALAKKWGAT